MRHCKVAVLSIVAGLAIGIGCEDWDWDKNKQDKPSMKTASMDKRSLYDRLGGEPAIRGVCEDFVGRAAANPKVNFFRKNVEGFPEWKPSAEELATFKKHLVQFVSKAAGGPQKYEGESMKESHRGMKITSAEFDAAAGDLAASLDKFNVPAKEKSELLSAVAATKPDIVEVR